MRVKDRDLLTRYMKERDMSGARLGRFAGVSRQFIYKLMDGDKTSCTPTVAKRIEEALQVLEGTLFERNESPQTQHRTTKTGRAA